MVARAAALFGTTTRLPRLSISFVARQLLSTIRPSISPIDTVSFSRNGCVIFSTSPENTSFSVFCSARPRITATAPDVATTPLNGRPST